MRTNKERIAALNNRYLPTKTKKAAAHWAFCLRKNTDTPLDLDRRRNLRNSEVALDSLLDAWDADIAAADRLRASR